jgi:hypothetical protein
MRSSFEHFRRDWHRGTVILTGSPLALDRLTVRVLAGEGERYANQSKSLCCGTISPRSNP